MSVYCGATGSVACFVQVPDVVEVMQRAGFCVEAQQGRVSYPGEAERRRAYPLGRAELCRRLQRGLRTGSVDYYPGRCR